jgi:hypothetical protein
MTDDGIKTGSGQWWEMDITLNQTGFGTRCFASFSMLFVRYIEMLVIPG